MPRYPTIQQQKLQEDFGKNPMSLSLGSILSWKDIQKYAEEKLQTSRFIPDLVPPMPSSSKVTVMISPRNMEQDINGTYVLTISTTIYSHERIFRFPGSGQPVYFNDTLLGMVKNTTLHETQFYAGDKCFMELQLDYPGRDHLFLRMMRIFDRFEATIDSQGIHFGSGADFEDLVKVTIEEERQRELRDVVELKNSWRSFSIFR